MKKENKEIKTKIMKKLVMLADTLDKNGFYKEAQELDDILKNIAQKSKISAGNILTNLNKLNDLMKVIPNYSRIVNEYMSATLANDKNIKQKMDELRQYINDKVQIFLADSKKLITDLESDFGQLKNLLEGK